MSDTFRDQKTVLKRREWIEKEKGLKLSNIAKFSLSEEAASQRHCENMIGIAQVPMGIAGPLKINGENENEKEYYIPLATTEGALVASVNRGCKAVSLSGGVNVVGEEIGMTRGPVFKTSSVNQSVELKKWIEMNSKILETVSNNTSNHLKLKKIESKIVGKYVYLRIYFYTGEAMGMNMATIASTEICNLIEKSTNASCVSVAGNFDIDKKPAWLNMIQGRGKSIWADATIKREVVKEVLKTTPEKIYDVWLAKNMLGSAVSGSIGFNAHFANIVAALYLATGQDIAHTVEGSIGITTTEIEEEKDLYISVYLPAVLVGSVGGGTALDTQKEALSILGLNNMENQSMMLAKLVGATTLAGELSLLASLSERSLAKAHKKLARKK